MKNRRPPVEGHAPTPRAASRPHADIHRPAFVLLALAAPALSLRLAHATEAPPPAATTPAAQESTDPLREVIVTAPRMSAPLTVETDPHRPRQPLPAHDGADYLKAIPGFNAIRKGGTDGDPVFRGMAASRVNILLDGEQILGGCGMRMDPPTAYIFPEAFDRIVVVKGPQTVLNGPGNSAATVRFESQPPAFDGRHWQALGSALTATAGRTDLVGDVAAGNTEVYARLNATRAEASDYTDGNGNGVHAAYERWSTKLALGWRPAPGSLVEITGALSNGHAAYADRLMDGAKFDRSNLGIRAERAFTGGIVRKVEAQAYYNYVDHVMDNYSLRAFAPSMMMPAPSASNPDRRTSGARLAFELGAQRGPSATIGVDYQQNRHRNRSTMNETMMPYESLARVADARFEQVGLFGEAQLPAGERTRVIAGARADRWQARDERTVVSTGMMGTAPNPTAGIERKRTLLGGFGRVEHDLPGAGTTLYAGVGHVERFPDYWELVSTARESTTSLSAFLTKPERTTQLDIGLVHRAGPLQLSVSGFASRIDDYILIQSDFRKGMRLASVSRNVDAGTLGAEADAQLAVGSNLKLTGTLAYTRGHNVTDGGALAQMPPLELRFGADYGRGNWRTGLLLRHVAAQDRVALNQGNVVGQDIGASPGFTVVSINAAVELPRGVLLTAGIDNLLDRNYAEHLSRGGAMLSGYTQTTRVNEPGRTAWLKLGMDLR
ncbi:MAG TPA: TonB-dependent copper receptor [Steroidobacteraceae bacterium]|nr:TonB-dependent copper receptor [Steroidobacteraceae bacterium]